MKLQSLGRELAACIIQDTEGGYLVVQEAQPKAYGLWNLPAGYVDKGESIELAAVRETKEESGLKVELMEKIGIWHDKVKEPIRHAFTAKMISGEIQPQPDEVLDVKWFSYDEITRMKAEGRFRVGWIFDAINRVESSRLAS